MSAINVTIAYNVVGNLGAGRWTLCRVGWPVTLDNTIVALNTRGGVGGPASDISLSKGTLSPFSSYNLVGTGGSGGMSNASNSNQVNVPASGLHLGTLAYNGGPTQTIALLAGSLAIDGGGTQIPGVSVPNVDRAEPSAGRPDSTPARRSMSALRSQLVLPGNNNPRFNGCRFDLRGHRLGQLQHQCESSQRRPQRGPQHSRIRHDG